MDIVTLAYLLAIFSGAFSTHLTGNARVSTRSGSLRHSPRSSFSQRGNHSNRRVPTITTAELRAIYRAREIRRQQKLLEQQRQLSQLSRIQSHSGSQQNIFSQLLTPKQPQQQQPQPQPQSQQQVLVSNDLLRNLLMAAIMGGKDLNTAAGGGQAQVSQQPAASTGSKSTAKTTQNINNNNNNPVVIETNGSIQLSEVKKANGQTHIVIDASSMGIAPLTATLKPGEDPPEPEIKLVGFKN